MKKKILVGLSLVAAAIIVFVTLNLFQGPWMLKQVQHDGNAAENPIKIGVVLPLSGNNAKLGEEGKKGIDFAIKNTPHTKNIEFIFEDDQKNSAKTASVANKLVNIDKVDVLINYSSQSAAVAAPIVAKSGVLQFAFSSDDAFTKLKGNYAYSTPIKVDAEVLLNSIKNHGYKKMAMVYEQDGYFPLVGEWIKKLAPDYGLELVFSEGVNPTDRDFKTVIAKSEAKGADVYILQAWMPIINILTRQLREVNQNVAITSTYSFALSDDLGMFEGQYFVNFGYEDNGFDAKFFDEYKTNPDLISAVMFSMTEMLIKAADRVSDVHNEQALREEIESIIKNESVLLKGMSLEENVIGFPSVLMVVENSKMKMVKE